MVYVELGRDTGGEYWTFDPLPYIEVLPVLAETLPRGAAAFALEPEHYNYYAPDKCTKDLKVIEMRYSDLKSPSVHLRLRYPGDADVDGVSKLSIRYEDVIALSIERVPDDGVDKYRLGHLLVDEIVPSSHGAIHELAFWSGKIRIECSDLTAVWSPDVGPV